MTLDYVYIAACIGLLAYIAPGYVLVCANHLHDPAMRGMPQVHQFFCVVLWPLTLRMARRARTRGK